METQLVYSLFWFATGAFLSQLLTTFVFRKKEQQMYLNLSKNMIVAADSFREQFDLAIDVKRQILKEVGLSDEKIDKECQPDVEFIENWHMIQLISAIKNTPRSILREEIANLKGKKQ